MKLALSLIMTGEKIMKCLKIEHGKGYFSLDEEEWTQLDTLDKSHILSIIKTCLNTSFEMDDYNEKAINNKAHEIIYVHLYDKFIELEQQRSRFKDESESLFRDAFVKYTSNVAGA